MQNTAMAALTDCLSLKDDYLYEIGVKYQDAQIVLDAKNKGTKCRFINHGCSNTANVEVVHAVSICTDQLPFPVMYRRLWWFGLSFSLCLNQSKK